VLLHTLCDGKQKVPPRRNTAQFANALESPASKSVPRVATLAISGHVAIAPSLGKRHQLDPRATLQRRQQ
jgi:hypothetical protein